MKILDTCALLGVLTIASPVAAEMGMNNNAGGASPGNIPGSMGSGTAENSPTEKPGTGPGKTRGDGHASAMKTPTPGDASMSGRDGGEPAIGE
jgi:hypothetical protein